MKSKLVLIPVFCMLALVMSCSTDVDDNEFPAVAATYTLFLENNTSQEIEIFFKGVDTGNEFEPKGIIAPGEVYGISNLGVRQTYVVRASYPGEFVDGFFYEQSINRSSPTDLTLVINE